MSGLKFIKQKKIVFTADKALIKTRSSDGAFIVTFETGEYMKNKIADLMREIGNKTYKVTVEPDA